MRIEIDAQRAFHEGYGHFVTVYLIFLVGWIGVAYLKGAFYGKLVCDTGEKRARGADLTQVPSFDRPCGFT